MLPRLVLTLIAAAIAAFAIACGDDSTQQSPTPTPRAPSSPTSEPTRPSRAESGSDDGFRAFAILLHEAVKDGDVAFISARYELSDTSCGQGDVGRNPYCTAFFHKYVGLPIGNWRSEGLITPPEVVTALIQERIDQQLPTAQDAFEWGWAQVAAINVQQDRYAAVITMLIPRPPDYGAGEPIRVAIGTSWRFDGERWRMTGGLNAGVLAEDLLTPGLPESPYPELEMFGTRGGASR